MAIILHQPTHPIPRTDLLISEEFIVEVLTKFRGSLNWRNKSFPPEVQTMLTYIHDHFFDRTLTVQGVKEACGFANNNVTSTFKQFVGVGPREYIANLRLTAASSVLGNGDVNIYLLAGAVGYTEEAFSRIFKKSFGCTPTQYCKQNAKTNGQEK